MHVIHHIVPARPFTRNVMYNRHCDFKFPTQVIWIERFNHTHVATPLSQELRGIGVDNFQPLDSKNEHWINFLNRQLS